MISKEVFHTALPFFHTYPYGEKVTWKNNVTDFLGQASEEIILDVNQLVC